MEIITNNKPRTLLAYAELSERERADFDYIPEEEHWSPRLFRYRGGVYDTLECVRIVPRARASGWAFGVDADSPLLAWHSIHIDSAFSGVLVRYPDPFADTVVVGFYIC